MGAPVQAGAPFYFRAIRNGDDLPVATLFYFGLFVLFHIYSFAFDFGISFDDTWNLSRLTDIQDFRSTMEFIAGGAAGPLGRPLALLSFVPHAASWPSAPQDFLYENALIHVLNTLLVFWLVYRLADHLPWRVTSPAWMALFAALWWGASPLLFSTSAMTIQRMTSLSALFCLLGCLLYVSGWQRLHDQKPRSGLLMMVLGVGGGTFLAVFTKENAAILPGLILLLDRLLLAPSVPVDKSLNIGLTRVYTALRVALLWLPICAVIAYLVLKLPEFRAGYGGRPFTMSERLFTEARIVVDYLKLLLFPVRSELSPFNDDYPLSTGLLQPVSTLFSIATLASMAVLAWFWRKGNWRVFSLAVAWFLWAHIIESTVVPLELYFEHRNYLPAIGIALGLAALLFHPQVRLAPRAVLVVLLLSGSLFVLRETALLWSDRPVAAASWYERHPNSLRALQFKLGVQFEHKRIDDYLSTVDSVRSPLRESAEYAMIRLAAACNFRSADEVAVSADNVVLKMRYMGFNNSVTDVLDKLVDQLQSGGCEGLTRAHIDEMIFAIANNPSPRVKADMQAQAHEIYARLTIADRDLNGTMRHLEEAFRLRPTLSVGIAMAGILTSANLYDEADEKLDELAAHVPSRPFVRDSWRTAVAEMREIVHKARSHAEVAQGIVH